MDIVNIFIQIWGEERGRWGISGLVVSSDPAPGARVITTFISLVQVVPGPL